MREARKPAQRRRLRVDASGARRRTALDVQPVRQLLHFMSRADDVCSMEVGSNPGSTKLNPLGVKGAGEAGTVGALPAMMNAIMDALGLLGVKEFDMPATGDRVWRGSRGVRGQRRK